MRKKIIDRETIWRAIKCEVTKKELDKILDYAYHYEESDYYNYQLIMDGVHLFMAGGITIGYFKDWLILLTVCLVESKLEHEELLWGYYLLAEMIDGFIYIDLHICTNEKQKECRRIMAVVKFLTIK